jgi:hypothetical protein
VGVGGASSVGDGVNSVESVESVADTSVESVADDER